MDYKIKQRLQRIEGSSNGQEEYDKYVKVLSYQQWEKINKGIGFPSHLTKGYDSIRFCKVESYEDYLFGTFNIPSYKKESKKRFFYYIQAHQIIFIDESGKVRTLLEQIETSKSFKHPSLEAFLYIFLEVLLEDDLLYLEQLEEQITKMEDIVLEGELKDFNHKMMRFRKEILTLHYYYSQLIEVLDHLQENENGYFKEENLKSFNLLVRKLTRLQVNAQMLREYSMQIQEEYQAQIDIRQNNVMKILTVVTAIFLPLTLIAGWYGMNFENMPELKWRYGYLSVVIVSILFIIISIWVCKKKKFL